MHNFNQKIWQWEAVLREPEWEKDEIHTWQEQQQAQLRKNIAEELAWHEAEIRARKDQEGIANDVEQKQNENKRSDGYYKVILKDCYKQLQTVWRAAQPKVTAKGILETGAEVEERTNILEQIIELKKDGEDENLPAWQWLQNLIKMLGDGGQEHDMAVRDRARTEYQEQSPSTLVKAKELIRLMLMEQKGAFDGFDEVDGSRETRQRFHRQRSKSSNFMELYLASPRLDEHNCSSSKMTFQDLLSGHDSFSLSVTRLLLNNNLPGPSFRA
ncbi:hypothetical protein BDR06DRAFT_967448 [Suillus hirtellus]|nr:hypothetical protein BDR06DRAFT_967448 [Suillus hirtellus]